MKNESIQFDPANLSINFQWVVFACYGSENEITMHGPFAERGDAADYVTEHSWPGDIFISKIETIGTVEVKSYFSEKDWSG